MTNPAVQLSTVDTGTITYVALFDAGIDAARKLAQCMELPNLPDRGQLLRFEDAVVSWFGANAFLFIAADNGAVRKFAPLFKPVSDNALGVVEELSAGYAALEVCGSKAFDVLSKGCPLDLHPEVFGWSTSARTVVFGVNVLIRRSDNGAGFNLLFGRSYQSALLRHLNDASYEFVSENCAE